MEKITASKSSRSFDQRGVITNHFYDSMKNRVRSQLSGGGEILYFCDPHGIL